MLLVLFCAFVLGAAAQCPMATDTLCDQDLLLCCGTQLAKDLGLQNCPGEKAGDLDCHRQEIEQMYTNGTDGLFEVCNAFNSYYACLGRARKDCTSVGYHMKLGLSLADSINAASMYKQFGFACGAGLEAFANNDACMAGVFKTNSQQLETCRRQFTANLLYDYPNHCLYFEQLTGCFQAVFQAQNCGGEGAWWGCEYARQGSKVIMHDCANQCYSLSIARAA